MRTLARPRSLALFLGLMALVAVSASRAARGQQRALGRGEVTTGAAGRSTAKRPAAQVESEQPTASRPRVVTQAVAPRDGAPAAARSENPREQSVAAPQMPPGFPLPPDQQQEIDQILQFWETQTSKIKTYQCKFTRQNFDTVFGDTKHPLSVDKGTIRYSAPDKGLMRVDEVWKYNAKAPQDQPFEKQDVQFGEYWVCDGEAIFQFDSKQKKLIEMHLPKEVRGQAIANGPLPFLFGAKANKMKDRYWIRQVNTAATAKDEYILEAIPKHQSDAANFLKIHLALQLNRDQLMPAKMRIFTQQGFVVYHFEDHAANDARHRLADFSKFFVRPSIPRGWTKVVEEWDQEPVVETAESAAPPAQARKPSTTKRK